MSTPPDPPTLLDQVLGSVIYAPDDTLDDAVDAGASALAATGPRWPAVSTALLAAADQRLRRAWEHGWQPTDLARMVRRDLTPTHLALATDLIAAESRRYAEPDLSPRWTAQLRELDATVHWQGDDTHLTQFAARHRLDRFGTAGCALELLRLIARLPRITPIAPPPPTHPTRTKTKTKPTAPTTPTPTHSPAAPRILSRVRALLAKAEATSFPDEAEALTAKAQQLVARYSIDEALLAAGPDGAPADGPGACRIGVEEPYAAAKAVLLDAVATANRCRSVWSSDLGFSTVVGYEPDLAAVELLHTSLLVQATTAMNRAADQHHLRGRSRRTRDFRQTFLVAFAGRIRERLTAAAHEAAAEAADADQNPDPTRPAEEARTPRTTADRLLPVLAAREVAVDDATDRMFPATTTSRLRGRDLAGWEHGTAAADRAHLHRPGRPNPPDHHLM
ncbi:DUF2786 domain-containing protein [Streptomyces sp. NPDC092296]|uniref:DUF2786 domain-containing protein n=1 Tax=Streptomyces sp. NPDC092296 TaxID=3366012 RepID=UPI00380AC789